jgi:hypothetical protein
MRNKLMNLAADFPEEAMELEQLESLIITALRAKCAK